MTRAGVLTRLAIAALVAAAIVAAAVVTTLRLARGDNAEGVANENAKQSAVADAFASHSIQDVSASVEVSAWGPPLEGATDLAFLPDGSAFITRKGGWGNSGTGEVLYVDTEGANPRRVLEIPVCSDAERGLVGIAIDPDFETNRYVYLNYTRDMNGCQIKRGADRTPENAVYSRVSRFRFTGPVIDPESEVVLLDGLDASASAHVGGGMVFMEDGTLLVGMGEADFLRPGSPGGGRAAHSPDFYEGKILRIDPRTPGTAPSDNPFAAEPYSVSEPRNVAWALGLRNPFRLAVDRESGAVVAADVGTDDIEELNFVVRGADYGYPRTEGPGSPEGTIDPAFWYRHTRPPHTDNSTPTPITCNSIIGAQFADGAIVGEPGERIVAFADFGCKKVWAATFDPDGDTVRDVYEIADVGYSMSSIVGHPDGRLIVLAVGPGEQQSVALSVP